MSEYYEKPISEYLRHPPKTLARSAYAVEVNPWIARGDIESALLFRGTIVSALGYIEGYLSEIAIRCSRMEQYYEISPRFPYKLSSKIKFLRRAFEMEPLRPYQRWAIQFFDRVENMSELRNMVAYARMQVLPHAGVTFHHYPEFHDGIVTVQREPMAIAKLELLAWKAAKLSRTFQYLLDKLNELEVIPRLEI